MKPLPKIVVITGAESTGKSTLANSLASTFDCPYIPEIAREYVEKLDRPYNYDDVCLIAKKQVEMLSELQNSPAPFVFLDTWLIITKIWLQIKFGQVPEWITKQIQSTQIDLFLLCDIDLPWVYDPVRENGGEQRKYLHNLYKQELVNHKFDYKLVSGKDEVRMQNAIDYLKLLK